MARDYLLPSSLVLLCVAVDFKAIVRLGPEAIIMFLTGTVGVMLGALVSFEAMRVIHPDTVAGDTWRGMATVAGAWIGGGANQAAMCEVFNVEATMFGQFVAVDVLVGSLRTAVLLFLASRAQAFDRWTGADLKALHRLRYSIEQYQAQLQVASAFHPVRWPGAERQREAQRYAGPYSFLSLNSPSMTMSSALSGVLLPVNLKKDERALSKTARRNQGYVRRNTVAKPMKAAGTYSPRDKKCNKHSTSMLTMSGRRTG